MMFSRFPVSSLNISVEKWVYLMKDPYSICYNSKTREFENAHYDQGLPSGFKSLTYDHVVDISTHLRPAFNPKQARRIGMDLSYLGFVRQSEFENGILGKIRALFEKVFNWLFRGQFVTSIDRCKALAQDLLGLNAILNDKKSKREYIGALKAYRRIFEVKNDPKICMLHECLGRWLVSKRSVRHVISRVLPATYSV